MGKNVEGQNWQNDFSSNFGDELMRLYDVQGGYLGVSNICDYIYYMYPFIGYFELKSCKGNRLDFSVISETQWNGLAAKTPIKGAMPAILVQFREAKECFIIPMKVLLAVARTRKSITLDMCRLDERIRHIPTIYKRTRCSVDVSKFERIFEFTNIEWWS